MVAALSANDTDLTAEARLELRPHSVDSNAGKPLVLISHPTGNQNLRNALRSLVDHEMLAEFWTTIAWDQKSYWNKILPSGLRAELERRSYADVPNDRVKCAPSREMIRLGAKRLMLDELLCSGEGPFSVIGMYRDFDAHVAERLKRINADAVYAYEGGALETFREARRLGITTMYELPSSHWYWELGLLSEEAKGNPEFAGLLPKLRDSPGHMRWKDEELSLADIVFVPSQHVRETLAGVVPDEKIRVVTYGAPPVQPRKPMARTPNEPLRVLFVGALSQRKGIGYLIDAIGALGSQVELTLVGSPVAPNTAVDAACHRWRWFPTLPHPQVLDLMRESDVLVLPSLAEGCALVDPEALSSGLPVIVTPNTGSLEFVQDGRDGFVVPIRSSSAIAERLKILARDRELLASMSQDAQTTAAGRSWEVYRETWAEALKAAL